MYNQINPNILRKAGDYILSDVTLISYQTADGSNPRKISVRDAVAEINIYESINNKCLSGDITLVDSQNVANHLPLTGFERIEFTFFTPAISKGFNFSMDSGHPMYIYRIANRVETNPRTQAYTLFFTSKEMLRNEQVRVSRAYDTSFDNVIMELVKHQDFLNSKKTLTVEETRGIHKVVLPRLRPFGAIDFISKSSQSKAFNNAYCYFYETANGFKYQSLESMLAVTNTVARPVVAKFVSKPINIKEGEDSDKSVIETMQIAEDVKIIDQFNTLKNLRNGVYASRMITHNAFNKTFSEIDFDYHQDYSLHFHTEHDGQGGKALSKYGLPFFPAENNKFYSDYPEGTLYFYTATEKIHNTNELPDYENFVGKTLSQKMMLQSMRIAMTVPGFTGLSAGDLIAYEMPSYEPADKKNPLDFDPYMSGRYIVESIRHRFDVARDKHIMNLECVKDSTRVPYPKETIDTFTNRETNKNNVNVLQYDLDDAVVTQTESKSNIFK